MIESLSPPQPTYGYVPGQQVTATGLGFSSQAGRNALEIWMFDPDNPHKVYDIRPLREDAGHLTFSLPADIAPGMWHLRAVVDAKESDFSVITVAAPGIVLTSIENAGQQPGTDIIITGQNFKPGVFHKITFTSMDIPPPDSAPAVAQAQPLTSQPATQILVRIPSHVLAGNNQVQVSIEDGVTPPSNVIGYVVGIPQYHVTFLNMRCHDETNWGGTEWTEDEVKTLWTIAADGAAWTKKSHGYSFDEEDKPEQSYTVEDGGAAFKDGQFGEIRYGLAIVTGLYELEDDDLEVAQQFLNVAGQVGAAIVSAAGGGSGAAAAVKAIGAGLAKLVKWAFDNTVTVGYHGSRPAAHPGPISMYWSARSLQKLLPTRNSETNIRTLDLHGDEDHGWYTVTYKIARN